jgi:hypothetical protein
MPPPGENPLEITIADGGIDLLGGAVGRGG